MKWGSWIFCIASTRNFNCEILKEQWVLQQGMTGLSSRMWGILFPYSWIPKFMLAELSLLVLALHTLPILSDYAIHSFTHSPFKYFVPSFTHYGTDMSTTYLTHVVVSYQWGRHFFVSQNQYRFMPIFIFVLFFNVIYSNFASCLGFYFYYERSLFLKWA